MKTKKQLCLSAAVLSVCCAFGALAGCSSADSSKGSLGLSYEKKYLYTNYSSTFGDTQTSILFHKDGTGELRHRAERKIEETSEEYTLFFKYLYYPEENTVFGFYDSVVYGEGHTAPKDVTSTATVAYLCTEELLQNLGVSGGVYVCEDYLPNLPNYAQKPGE